jgi:hypothetical protein
MILTNETEKNFGYKPDEVGKFSKNKLLIECDNCKVVFDKTSCQINMCRRNSKSQTDICNKIECLNWKRNNTMMNRFGVKNAGQSNLLREKVKNTCLRKFGTENAMDSKIVQQMSKDGCMKKFGVENPFQSNIIKDKIKKSMLAKYGVEYSSQIESSKNKKKKTFETKWGGCGRGSPEIMKKITKTIVERNGGFGYGSSITSKKIKLTNLNKFGTEYPSQSSEVKNKTMASHKAKYGCHYFQTSEFKAIRKITNVEKYGQENPILEFSRLSRGRISKFQKSVYAYVLSNDPQSEMEKEINENISSDIYIPSKNKIIECYGDYWHCNPLKYKPSFYHKNLKMTAKEIWYRDEMRILEIKKAGYDVEILWEKDWNNKKRPTI